MSDYTIQVTSISGGKQPNADTNARGTINIDDVIVKWNLHSTNRHQYDAGDSEWTVLVPAMALRTNPPGWRKHKDAKKILKTIKDAVAAEEDRRYCEKKRAEALAAGLPWPPPCVPTPGGITEDDIPF